MELFSFTCRIHSRLCNQLLETVVKVPSSVYLGCTHLDSLLQTVSCLDLVPECEFASYTFVLEQAEGAQLPETCSSHSSDALKARFKILDQLLSANIQPMTKADQAQHPQAKSTLSTRAERSVNNNHHHVYQCYSLAKLSSGGQGMLFLLLGLNLYLGINVCPGTCVYLCLYLQPEHRLIQDLLSRHSKEINYL